MILTAYAQAYALIYSRSAVLVMATWLATVGGVSTMGG